MNAFRNYINISKTNQARNSYRAFTMVELLVVIAIIAVLAGLLLVALNGARNRAEVTQTTSTMQSFGQACDAFNLDHGQYPGVIPEALLAANPLITGTENAILHLLGGFVRGDNPNYASYVEANGWFEYIIADTPLGKIKINTRMIGNGPEINGTLYSPYFTPKGSELAITSGQVSMGFVTNNPGIPDLIDSWGQPIVYVRRSRPIGPLALDNADPDIPSQFLYDTMKPYIESTGLGEFGKDQMAGDKGSVFNNAPDRFATFAQLLRHPAFGAPDDPLRGNSQGEYMLFSAGPDGIYFSIADGPGTPTDTVNNIVNDPDFGNPLVVREYDDIRIFGGG